MRKEELTAAAVNFATIFAAPAFAPDKATILGTVDDNQSLATLGQVIEPGKYLVHSVTDAKIETKEKQEIDSIRWNLLSEDGVPCSIYNGTLTRGVASASAAKAGLLGTFGQAKATLIGKALNVTAIERSEPDADNRRKVLKLTYTVSEF